MILNDRNATPDGVTLRCIAFSRARCLEATEDRPGSVDFNDVQIVNKRARWVTPNPDFKAAPLLDV